MAREHLVGSKLRFSCSLDALGALGLAGYDLCERPTEVSSDFLKCDYSVPVSVWNLTEDLSIFSGS